MRFFDTACSRHTRASFRGINWADLEYATQFMAEVGSSSRPIFLGPRLVDISELFSQDGAAAAGTLDEASSGWSRRSEGLGCLNVGLVTG